MPRQTTRAAVVAACISSISAADQSTAPSGNAQPVAAIVIQSFAQGVAGGCSSKPGIALRTGRDPSLPDERVLLVDYPAPTADPAGRDVRCEAERQDWTGGRAISFQVKPAHDMRLSVSFMDRNRVAYTAWTTLKGGAWQSVRIPFDEIRPNPYFQPPDAKTDAALDVSDVKALMFAPQDQTSGLLAISRFVLSN
jgi:Carbohydrate binding domain (family 11)